MKRIILTADDFGIAPEVNAAIAQGHRDGVLTCASLMIGAPAAQDAVALARTLPTLAVGLHIVVADGMPVLPADQIPDLVDSRGRLRGDLAVAGARMFFLTRVREQLAQEIAAQFAAFEDTGLACDHVNAHNHMHLHPTVLSLIMQEAKPRGIKHLRLPHEPGQLALAPWIALMRNRLQGQGFICNDRLAGMAQTGHMTEARVLALLETVGEGSTELYFHPATRATAALEAEAPGYDRAGELAALTSPRVKARIESLGLTLSAFRDLR